MKSSPVIRAIVVLIVVTLLAAACRSTPSTTTPPASTETTPPTSTETTPPASTETTPPTSTETTLSTSVSTLGREVKVEGGSYRLITVDQLTTLLKNKDFFLVCITPGLALDIPTTDLTISYKEISGNLGKFPLNKASKTVVYDGGDDTGHIAIETLIKAGYTNVVLVEGGITAWKNLLE